MGIAGAARLVLSEADKKQLMRIGRHRSTRRGIVLRVEIVRAAAERMANRAIAQPRYRVPGMDQAYAAAASRRELQVQQRSAVRAEGPRHCGTICEPAGQGDG